MTALTCACVDVLAEFPNKAFPSLQQQTETSMARMFLFTFIHPHNTTSSALLKILYSFAKYFNKLFRRRN